MSAATTGDIPQAKAGLFGHLSALLAAKLAYLKARLELAGIEGKEAAIHLAIILGLAVMALVLVIFGYAFVVLALVFLIALAFGGGNAWIWVLIGAAVMSLLTPTFDWPAHMPWPHVALVVVGAVLGTLGHFLFILAFRHAPASGLTPFTYVQLVWATLFGWLVYAHLPGPLTWAGMAIIALSGLFITLHERRAARDAVAGPARMRESPLLK